MFTVVVKVEQFEDLFRSCSLVYAIQSGFNSFVSSAPMTGAIEYKPHGEHRSSFGVYSVETLRRFPSVVVIKHFVRFSTVILIIQFESQTLDV
tara:strand:- start:778 stop:1056 length:279 start_codon:yes stop_codon:yes gene_type:complete